MASQKGFTVYAMFVSFVLFQLFLFALVAYYVQQKSLPNISLRSIVIDAVSKASAIMTKINIVLSMLLNCRSVSWWVPGIFPYTLDATKPVLMAAAIFSISHIATYLGGFSLGLIRNETIHIGTGLTSVVLKAGVGWSGLIMLALVCLLAADFTFLNSRRANLGLLMTLLAFLAAHERFYVPDQSKESFVNGTESLWKFALVGAIALVVDTFIWQLGRRRKVRMPHDNLFNDWTLMKYYKQARILQVQLLNGVLEIRFQKLAFQPFAGQV